MFHVVLDTAPKNDENEIIITWQVSLRDVEKKVFKLGICVIYWAQ